MSQRASARILLFDIETAPNLSYVWGRYEQNVIDVHTNWYILSVACKWLNESKIHVRALPDYPSSFKRDREDDRALVCHLWEHFDQADIVVAHNGDKFDIRKSNARFAYHGLDPPSPYKSVDTLKLARKHFQFDSNRLDDLGGYLKIGRKLPTTGKHLWFGCMSGDPKAWKQMRAYNRHDVELLEAVYLKLRPWSTNHPNLSYFSRSELNCPVCESSKTAADGFDYNRCSKKARRKCCDCGKRYMVGGPIAL